MGQTDRDLLIEMGFDPRRVDIALKSSGGLQDAITWLGSHEDDKIEDLEKESSTGVPAAPSSTEADAGDGKSAANAEAKSYKCNDCGKLLRNWDAVQFHAERTEHQNFDESVEEIKPLTEEEKKAKLEELKQRLAEKRQLQTAESVSDAKRNEAIRRKKDRESEKMKEELRKKEQLRDIERRKQEKIDDAKAKAKIKAEIAATQQARREAAAKAKAEREGTVAAQASVPQETSAPSTSKAAHTEARLRFQVSGRPPITKTYPAETSLFEVASSLAQETGIAISTFTTTFPPRKTYRLEEPLDSSLTLKEANLTPSASLLVG
ncbi:uncharacterized protein DFL_000215 [Arthrobotrys flagrans]|uniref:C2H2-type domain-containing protein n=1 Tax=Arthrobotrys flagrans TaxID=97331 RepID=A0A437AD37_ARTFL|nr:hypothetical protein DFL_000215 [Arthrobotrys flagrans]